MTGDQRSRPLFAAGTTAIVAGLLVVPFALRTLSSAVEPYPAVLLPAGPGKVPVSNGTAGFSVRSLLGHRPDGSEAPLDPVTFLAPIPVQYLYALADSEFGQRTKRDGTITLRGLHVTIDAPPPRPTASSRTAAAEWLRGKLTAAGLSPDALIILDEWVTVELSSGRELTRAAQKEITVDLG
jgi:hypothetical protein